MKLEPEELTAMRHAARTVARWQKEYRDEPDYARRLVLELIVVSGPTFRATYLTAFGQ